MVVAAIVLSVILAVGLIVFFVGREVRRANLAAKSTPMQKVSFKQWLINHKPSKRRLIQVYAALLYNANIKGFVSGNIYTSETTKYMCVPGLNCYSCPGAVGACPMGAFQNALAESNTRAPYYILGILALFGLTLARTICGFLCPIGMCQELLYKVRTPKLKKSRVTRVLSFFKYVILVLAVSIPLVFAVRDLPLPAFCKYICPAGTFGGAIMLLANPGNAGLFGQLGWQFTWKFGLLVAFAVLSVFIFRFFCRFICPLGAIYGFFNRYALMGVTVDSESCTDCGLCVQRCKMDIKHVGDHECINCGECIAVCPAKAISWKGSKIFLKKSMAGEPIPAVKPVAVGAGTVTIPTTDAIASAAAETSANVNADSAATMDAQAIDTVAVAHGAVVAEQPVAEKTEKAEAKPRKKREASFWVEMTAWIAAAVVLITALVFYNFIDTEKPYTPPPGGDENVGYNVGEYAPDFTISLYDGGGEFNLKNNRGKATVINFWATWCTPCVQEIPYFIEFSAAHPEITVLAVQGRATVPDVQAFIDRNWAEHDTIVFAQDNLEGTTCLTYRALGGNGMWPMTVIVDENGVVRYNSTNSFHSAADLEQTVTAALSASAS